MNFAPYRFTIAEGQSPPWHMDLRHIAALHRLAMLPALRTVVEIGSYRGASTAAFVEALRAGASFQLTVHEPVVRPALQRVLAMAPAGSTRIEMMPFWESDTIPDLVLIDGDHQWPAVADTLAALARNSGIIVMHDTSAHPDFRDCWGAALAARELKQALGRQWVQDATRRLGEWTHRGMLISWRNDLDVETPTFEEMAILTAAPDADSDTL